MHSNKILNNLEIWKFTWSQKICYAICAFLVVFCYIACTVAILQLALYSDHWVYPATNAVQFVHWRSNERTDNKITKRNQIKGETVIALIFADNIAFYTEKKDQQNTLIKKC